MTGLSRLVGFAFGKILPALILAGLGIVAFVVLYAGRKRQEPRDETVPPPQVTTLETLDYNGPLMITAKGVVIPHREIVMSAEVAGTIATKTPECQAGRWVKAGTPLLMIDDRELAIAVRQFTTEVRQADVQLQELDVEVQNATDLKALAERDLELAMREMQRVESLRGRISDSEIDQTERSVNQVRNTLVQQDNQLKLLIARRSRLESARELAQVALERAELDLARTKILAPSDGVIVSEQVEEGTYVQPGTRLLVFEDTTRAEVQFNLKVEEIFWLLQDRTVSNLPDETGAVPFRLPRIENVEVTFDVAGRSLAWKGRIDGFAGHGVDERTRNVPIRVIVDQPHFDQTDAVAMLRRGMFVSISIPVQSRLPLIAFPASSLKAGNRVWVVRNNSLQILPVKIAGRIDDIPGHPLPFTSLSQGESATGEAKPHWILGLLEEGGPEPGDRMIDSPLTAPFSGMQVEMVDKIAPDSPPADSANLSPNPSNSAG